MLLASVSVANNLTFLTAWSQLVLLFRSNVGIHGTYDVDCSRSLSKGQRDLRNQRMQLSTYLHLVPSLKRVGQAYVFVEWCLCAPHVLVKNFAQNLSVGLSHSQDEKQLYA